MYGLWDELTAAKETSWKTAVIVNGIWSFGKKFPRKTSVLARAAVKTVDTAETWRRGPAGDAEIMVRDREKT